MIPLARAAVAVALVLAAGCTGGAAARSATPAPSPAVAAPDPSAAASPSSAGTIGGMAVDPALLGPLQLPPCASPPAAVADPPPGATLPPGAVVTAVQEQGPVTQVMGYVPMTPIQLRVDLQTRAGLTVLTAEDEVFEAELLVSDGTHRTFLKAQAQCAEGSQFVALVAAELDPEAVLPTPTGAG